MYCSIQRVSVHVEVKTPLRTPTHKMYSGSSSSLNALVVDFGTFSTRIGYAGEDVPQIHVSSTLGKSKNTTITGCTFDPLLSSTPSVVQTPFSLSPLNAIDIQWNLYVEFLDMAYDRLQTTSSAHPVAMTESLYTSKADREHIVQLLFEDYSIPGLLLLPSPLASCYANARTTALLLDCGASSCTAVPIVDGVVQRHAVQRSAMGGASLDAYLWKKVEKLKEWENLENGWESQKRMELIREMKETVCRVFDGPVDPIAQEKMPKMSYELPDGTTLMLGTERLMTPEQLFGAVDSTEDSLTMLVEKAVMASDKDSRKELWQNIIITGGSSCFENLPIRLERELAMKLPVGTKLKVIAAQFPERKISAWLGTSIVASLGSHHDMWMSKEEYAEFGPSLIHRKCA